MTTIAAPRRTDTENPRAVMGGNRPPLDVEARFAFDEALEATKPGLRERIDQLLAASDRASATDEESAGKCGELVKQIRAAAKAVDDAHTTAKGPYLAAGRAVDAAKNELRGPLDTAKGKVEAKQTQFLREQEAIRQAELRRQREAEEARRREEAERAAAEQASTAAPVEVAPPPPPPPAPEPERQVIRGDYGATVSGQKVWLSQVEDYEVAFIAVANNSKVREAIDTAIKAMVRGGVHEIPGVRIWSDVKASNR
ncbi:hypothetical protein MRBLMC3_000786 [Sphingobium sp. LMC3-1-1.1]|uniref:hypothetical protein n=1 Tax=Sphingobium sp. LMC3-1-1.1 TaxID=3135241 RepID=UPI003447564A